MAEYSPVLPMRDGGARFGVGQPIFPRSRSGSESDSELSQSLARTKIRSYGSTASVAASLGEKYVEHRVTDSDTLQGIALKYGVTMEQIKRANKLFSNDCIFLRNSLHIPVVSDKCSPFNGLSLESPDGEAQAQDFTPLCGVQDRNRVTEEDPLPPPTSAPGAGDKDIDNIKRHQPEELSAKDFLHRLDLQIKQSKQTARRLKEEEETILNIKPYQHLR
uniref:LysM and putative peptidoglycan-binding domain-containing protein 2 n=1 Tax=Esox lucius TaxID=8010 RepID=A0A3P8XBS6_ESOLU